MKFSAPTYQPGRIRNLKELEEQIEMLERTNASRKENFYGSLHLLPGYAVTKTINAAGTFVLAKMMAGTTAKMVNIGAKMLLNSKEKNKLLNLKSRFLKNAGKMGVVVAAKMAFNKMMNKNLTDPI